MPDVDPPDQRIAELEGLLKAALGIMLGVFRGDLEPSEGDQALSDLDDDYAQGRLAVVDLLWRRALDHALRLSRDHTPTRGTRTLDVLHVSSAVTIGCRRFITYDERQAKLAKAVGLKVLMP